MNKRTLVTKSNLSGCIERIEAYAYYGIDTEAYALDIHTDLFAIQIATKDEAFYFNFHTYYTGEEVLDRMLVAIALQKLFSNRDKMWFIHNAKFDLHKLYNFMSRANLTVPIYVLKGLIHCTQSVERLIYNQHLKYDLDSCLKRRGHNKDDKVKEYIKTNKCFTWQTIPYKKKRQKNKHFEQVPFDIMFKYGCIDAEEVLFLGLDQLASAVEPSVYQRECRLIKTLTKVERRGVLYDKQYTDMGLKHEERNLISLQEEATKISGEEFKGGRNWLRSAFDNCGQRYEINAQTGNPIFDKEALEKMESPIARLVIKIRNHEKMMGTYYASFNHFADGNGVIHANIRNSGTDTGRFSYSDPNLQNVPKEEKKKKGDFQIRKCFIPRQDYCFVMIDFDQQEFRLMLDYAAEHDLIAEILAGKDVHQATADMVSIERKPAKTLNFGLLYGMGVEKLAKALSLTSPMAKSLKNKYFYKLQGVKVLIQDIIRVAETRRYIKTWAGRKLYFPNKDFAYKAPNHLIQGGCGDIAKEAMNRLDDYLEGKKSAMLIQVHDEILFEVHKSELDIVPELQDIMSKVYVPKNGMTLTCGVEHSWVSWGKQDVVDSYPTTEDA